MASDDITINKDYSLRYLKEDGYLKGLPEKQINTFILLLELYEMIHDFGGSRVNEDYRDNVRKLIDKNKKKLLDSDLLFGKKIKFTFTSGKVEDAFRDLIEENLILDINRKTYTYTELTEDKLKKSPYNLIELVKESENDEMVLSSDIKRKIIGQNIYDFFCGDTNPKVPLKLICDAIGGSKSLLAKLFIKIPETIYLKTAATYFDSAVTVDQLFNLDATIDSERRNPNLLDIGDIYLQHYNKDDESKGGPGFDFIKLKETKMGGELQHITYDGDAINKFTQPKQGPSVSKLGCLISTNNLSNDADNGKCSSEIKNMYKFENITPKLNNLQSYLFDIKRNGDHLQALATHFLNLKEKGAFYHIFCSIDRLAVHFARLLKIPCIWVNSESGNIILYKGGGKQVLNADPELVKKNNLILAHKKLEHLKKENILIVRNDEKIILEKISKLLPGFKKEKLNTITSELLTYLTSIRNSIKTKIKPFLISCIQKKLEKNNITSTGFLQMIKKYFEGDEEKYNILMNTLKAKSETPIKKLILFYNILNILPFKNMLTQNWTKVSENILKEIDSISSKLNTKKCKIPRKKYSLFFKNDLLILISDVVQHVISYLRLMKNKRPRPHLVAEQQLTVNSSLSIFLFDETISLSTSGGASKTNDKTFISTLVSSINNTNNIENLKTTFNKELTDANISELNLDDNTLDTLKNKFQDIFTEQNKIRGELSQSDIDKLEIISKEEIAAAFGQISSREESKSPAAPSAPAAAPSAPAAPAESKKSQKPSTKTKQTKLRKSTRTRNLTKRYKPPSKGGNFTMFGGAFTENEQIIITTDFTENFYYYLMQFLNYFIKTIPTVNELNSTIIKEYIIPYFQVNFLQKMIAKYTNELTFTGHDIANLIIVDDAINYVLDNPESINIFNNKGELFIYEILFITFWNNLLAFLKDDEDIEKNAYYFFKNLHQILNSINKNSGIKIKEENTEITIVSNINECKLLILRLIFYIQKAIIGNVTPENISIDDILGGNGGDKKIEYSKNANILFIKRSTRNKFMGHIFLNISPEKDTNIITAMGKKKNKKYTRKKRKKKKKTKKLKIVSTFVSKIRSKLSRKKRIKKKKTQNKFKRKINRKNKK